MHGMLITVDVNVSTASIRGINVSVFPNARTIILVGALFSVRSNLQNLFASNCGCFCQGMFRCTLLPITDILVCQINSHQDKIICTFYSVMGKHHAKISLFAVHYPLDYTTDDNAQNL